jgi:hypothetical protein
MRSNELNVTVLSGTYSVVLFLVLSPVLPHAAKVNPVIAKKSSGHADIVFFKENSPSLFFSAS